MSWMNGMESLRKIKFAVDTFKITMLVCKQSTLCDRYLKSHVESPRPNPTFDMNAVHFMRPVLTDHLIHEPDKRSRPVRRMPCLIRDMFVSTNYITDKVISWTALLLWTHFYTCVSRLGGNTTGFIIALLVLMNGQLMLNWILLEWILLCLYKTR